MQLSSIFDRFVEKSPLSVMVRGLTERVLNPEQLDEWFERTAEAQYTRDLMFSTVFDIMSDVVGTSHKSVHSAYQASRNEIAVSITSLYNKLNGIEPNTSAELVRYASGETAALIEALGGAQASLLPGFQVKLLDGNCIRNTDHRIQELRTLGAGALPGKSLVVLDPALRIPIDVFPCEDGHAQERSLLDAVLLSVTKNDLWIADRNFCVLSFVNGIDGRDGFFIIRKHGQFPYECLGKEKKVGKIETGTVYEQWINVTAEDGTIKKYRLIRVRLDKATRDGDKDLYIVTNLPKSRAHAKTVADLYRKRWTIETAFQSLERDLNSEINTLGYPSAALFGFCVALVVYMMSAVVKAAMSHVHGAETIDKEVSGYYIADELSATYCGMMIAIPSEEWRVFRTFTQNEFVSLLIQLATNMKLFKYQKHPRGPKKKTPKRKYDPKHPHVSTAKLLAARKKKG